MLVTAREDRRPQDSLAVKPPLVGILSALPTAGLPFALHLE